MFHFQEITSMPGGQQQSKKKQKLHCADQIIQQLRASTAPFGGAKFTKKTKK
jgi:hypothetical protein